MNDNISAPATKADLKELATKADLQKLEQATKADLQKLEQATKADIQKLATKTELKELEQKIEKVYLSQVQADSRLEQKMDKMMDKMDKVYSSVMSAYEKNIFKGEKYDQKALTHAAILSDHTAQITGHETRLRKLEAK